MIHGWGIENYNSRIDCEQIGEDVAWRHRKRLVDLLLEKYPVRFFNLPGFCCVAEPKAAYFDLEDFSDNLANWLSGQVTKPAAIVGYSFGGAVALDYKIRHRSDVPVVLIAPALKRKETIKSQLGGFGRKIAPRKYADTLKSLYQTIFSRYYSEGTPFLRASYDKIARRDLRPMLGTVAPSELLLVYGDADKSTPAEYITKIVEQHHLNCMIIPGGDHNIGETHPDKIAAAIVSFISKSHDF